MGLELMSYKLKLPHNNDPIFRALMLVYQSALEILPLFFPLPLCCRILFVWEETFLSIFIILEEQKPQSQRHLKKPFREFMNVKGWENNWLFMWKRKVARALKGEKRTEDVLHSLLKGTHLKTDTNPCHLGGHCLHPVSRIAYRDDYFDYFFFFLR